MTKKDDMESKTYLLYGKDVNGTTNFYEYNRMNDTLKQYEPDYGGTTIVSQQRKTKNVFTKYWF